MNPVVARPLAAKSTVELIRRLVTVSRELVVNEAELAKLELRADVRREVAAVKTIGVALVCAIAVVNLLLIALVFVLASRLQPWAAALLVAALVSTAGGIVFAVGWSRLVERPLARSRTSLELDLRRARQPFQ